MHLSDGFSSSNPNRFLLVAGVSSTTWSLSTLTIATFIHVVVNRRTAAPGKPACVCKRRDLSFQCSLEMELSTSLGTSHVCWSMLLPTEKCLSTWSFPSRVYGYQLFFAKQKKAAQRRGLCPPFWPKAKNVISAGGARQEIVYADNRRPGVVLPRMELCYRRIDRYGLRRKHGKLLALLQLQLTRVCLQDITTWRPAKLFFIFDRFTRFEVAIFRSGEPDCWLGAAELGIQFPSGEDCTADDGPMNQVLKSDVQYLLDELYAREKPSAGA